MWSVADQMQEMFWWLCSASVLVTGVSAWADRRRNGRADIEAVGFMPWPLIMVISMLSAAIMAALALKAG